MAAAGGGGCGESEYRTLLEIAGAVAASRNLRELVEVLGARLDSVVGSELVFLALHEPATDTMRYIYIAAQAPRREATTLSGMPVQDSAAGVVMRSQARLLIADTETETRFPKPVQALRERGVRSCWLFPLATPRATLGAIGFASARPRRNEDGAELFQRVTDLVAVVVENAQSHERAEALQKELAAERDRLRLLLDVSDAVAAQLDLRRLLGAVGERLRPLLHYEWASVALYDPEADGLRVHVIDRVGEERTVTEDVVAPMGSAPGTQAFATRRPVVTGTLAELEAYRSEFASRLAGAGIRSVCAVPLLTHGKPLGTLNVVSPREAAFPPCVVELLTQVAGQIAPAVEAALAYREIERLKDKLAEEKLYLEEEIRADFGEIVGESPALRRILSEVETVATTDSTVLIWGETGTGKELIARAIHRLSGRRDRTFVKLNCASIPTGLLESELFGHERGAFTGAIAQKVGRFELAHRGTLFLDEVGDIPAELQPKLLRVLQEQEFERLGGTKTIKVDVRLVAATNRDLAAMVAERAFRSDLYYRLNVFPVTVPSLRERREDVPALVRHFVALFARRMSKRIETVPADVMEALAGYAWPGNIRELQNLIERAVILTRGTTLHVTLPEPVRGAAHGPAAAAPAGASPAAAGAPAGAAAPARPPTFREAEQAAILAALEATNWVVSGPAGAAARLGLSRTTLQAKMEKLGIARPH